MNNSKIITNHLGYLCHATKKVIVQSNEPLQKFSVQDMGLVAAENFGEDENWQEIFSGKLERQTGVDGEYYVGDFSAITKPGVYSILIPEINRRAYQFIISNGIYHQLPWIFVDFLRNWSGNRETPLKLKSTTDDGKRSDNGEYHSVVSGWYDAGDLRKWMTHTNLPALGFYDLVEKRGFKRNYFHEDNLFENDMLTESDQAVSLILEMQDPETGKIFECLGAGGLGRADENMSWWYENHSGCLADNSDNRFTDNQINSGDERTIRTDYNALIQYTSIYILLRAYPHYVEKFPSKAREILKAATKVWNYTLSQTGSDPHENRTAIKSWKLMASLELLKYEIISETEVINSVDSLLKNYCNVISFWCQDEKLNDPYRGILHSAQPIIALIHYLKSGLKISNQQEIESLLLKTWEDYIFPLSKLTVFGYMPFGTYFQPASENDIYTKFRDGLYFRRFMPNHSKQKINHGLNGHYTSWAHALAMMGNYFENSEMVNLAWNHLNLPLGFNEYGVSFISGVGYQNPMPHSRFLGTQIGGFMAGFIGNTDDTPHVDLLAKAQWNSTEYWVTPIANFCMALSELLPEIVSGDAKLGLCS